jgi:hypothetical protein
VAKVDAERVHFVKDHFHKDPNATRHYDLMLNTARFSLDECAEIILEALRRLQARAGGKPLSQTAPCRAGSR